VRTKFVATEGHRAARFIPTTTLLPSCLHTTSAYTACGRRDTSPSDVYSTPGVWDDVSLLDTGSMTSPPTGRSRSRRLHTAGVSWTATSGIRVAPPLPGQSTAHTFPLLLWFQRSPDYTHTTHRGAPVSFWFDGSWNYTPLLTLPPGHHVDGLTVPYLVASVALHSTFLTHTDTLLHGTG